MDINNNDIPYGNSDFQIVNFIVNEITPERALRSCLLNLRQKAIALKESQIRLKRYIIDIDETKEKLAKIENKFEKQRLEVLIEEKTFYLMMEEKLVKDCIREYEVLLACFNKLPKITREEFENKERDYWFNRLRNNAINELKTGGRIEKGTLESLNKMGINISHEQNKSLPIPILKLESIQEKKVL